MKKQMRLMGSFSFFFVNTVWKHTKANQTENKSEHWKRTLAIQLSAKKKSPDIRNKCNSKKMPKEDVKRN